MRDAILTLIFSVGALCAVPETFAELSPLPSSTPRPTVEAYRLQFESVVSEQGLRVVGIQPGSPVLHMKSAQQDDLQGVMEIDDYVVAVDGRKIRTIDDYYDAMAASEGKNGLVELTVADGATGEPHRWSVQARKVQVPNSNELVDRKRKAHFLLIGLTKDSTIGPAMETTLELWRQPIASIDEDRRGNVRVVDGSECKAESIVEAVRDMQIASRDTLFCVYCGHGAFDPIRAATGDNSGGHFLYIRPSGDLMRKTLVDELLAKRARLTVLFTDTCNVKEKALPAVITEQRTRSILVMGLSPFDKLLFNYRGVVDISATDFDQYGFCQPGLGSWFSVSAVPVLQRQSDWRTAFEQMKLTVNADFQKRKGAYGITQASLTPKDFLIDVYNDEASTTLPTSTPPQPKETMIYQQTEMATQ